MLGYRSNHHTLGFRPLSSWVEGYSRRQQFRRMAHTLLAERDDILADMGYERYDVVSALNLPLRVDAVKYLEGRRANAQRRANRHTH